MLQDVFLRTHAALRTGVVPLEPRAWLLRLVRNASLDELRRARPVGEIALDELPAVTAQLPEDFAHRAEARALLGDIHRLPDRQRSVLVMSAIDGLSHEEVAGRLDTTVETTRSLLARARENLRRTAAARETACASVRDALETAASSRVRASEIARRHLWSCAACRAHQRDLRVPSRLRRLAGWSPWAVLAQLVGGGGIATVQKVAVGACCALVLGGGAVTVPQIAEHHGSAPPQLAAVIPEDVLPVAAPRRARRTERPPAVVPAATAVPVVATVVPRPVATPRPPAKRVRRTVSEKRQVQAYLRSFLRRKPSRGEIARVTGLMRSYRQQPKGSRQRSLALMRLRNAAFGTFPAIATPGPPKGITAPAPTPTPTPTAPPAPTVTPSPAPSPEPTPSPTATSTPTL